MDEFWLFFLVVLVVGCLLGNCSGFFIGQRYRSTQERQDMHRRHDKLVALETSVMEKGDIFHCTRARDIYHLTPNCGKTGGKSEPMNKRSLCRGCLKEYLKE
jgi:hypothetical protein